MFRCAVPRTEYGQYNVVLARSCPVYTCELPVKAVYEFLAPRQRTVYSVLRRGFNLLVELPAYSWYKFEA